MELEEVRYCGICHKEEDVNTMTTTAVSWIQCSICDICHVLTIV